jgi:hypothetical protein
MEKGKSVTRNTIGAKCQGCEERITSPESRQVISKLCGGILRQSREYAWSIIYKRPGAELAHGIAQMAESSIQC